MFFLKSCVTATYVRIIITVLVYVVLVYIVLVYIVLVYIVLVCCMSLVAYCVVQCIKILLERYAS